MRFAPLAALAAALAAGPVLAQDRSGTDAALETAERLNDPVLQDGIARTVQSMAGIVLDTRIGALARLANPADDIHPDDTLRDVQRRDDPWFEERLYADARRSTAQAGAVAGGMAQMLPEFARTAARLRGVMGGAMGGIGGQGGFGNPGGIDAPVPAPIDDLPHDDEY